MILRIYHKVTLREVGTNDYVFTLSISVYINFQTKHNVSVIRMEVRMRP